MLIRILYFIFLIVFIRFIVRLVREILRPPRPKPDPEPRLRRRDDPIRGQRVIDVDYEEVKPGDKTKENSR